MTNNRYCVRVSRANMPAKCWGGMSYYHCAVVELKEGFRPSDVTMISTRSKAVEKIVEYWGPAFSGRTDRSAFKRNLAEAHELCRQLNEAEGQ